MQKAFIWKNLTLKIKHEILCNSSEESSLKNVDINSKLQTSKAHDDYVINNYMISFMNGN